MYARGGGGGETGAGRGAWEGSPPGVAVRDLVQYLGRNQVLTGVSFRAGPGEVLAVMGPNGAGKTTLLRVLATLLPPTRGEVLVAGRPVRSGDPAVRRHIGYLGHQTFLYPQLTGWENLWFWARAFGVPRAADRVREVLDAVGLGLFAHEAVRYYSRGMQQRLALARTMLHDPAVLLLDEPYTGLDPGAAEMLDGFLHGWRSRGRTVVMTGHDAGRMLAAADRVLVLRRGRVAWVGAAGETDADRLGALCSPQGGTVEGASRAGGGGG